ncbi:condensation domain-containing protein [Streptomyces sp. NPDC006487]|uniref:condensation domain-containing protein n=1 Tax=Streptomyces sp. NPDC006487 TaxID=3364748 RepID=UPI00367617E6
MTGSSLPLSAGQEAMWFLHRLAPESAAYNIVLGVRVHSALDEGALRRATAELARRHELLRSLYQEEDGRPLRRPAPRPDTPFEVHEATGASDAELADLARAAGARPFRLSQGPPYRVVLLRRGPADAALVVAAHHIAGDATSQWLMLRDLLDAYAGFAAGGPGGLPAAEVPYGAHVAEERRLAATPARQRAERYWAALGEGTVAATLPADRPRGAAAALRGATHAHRIDPELAQRLPKAAALARATPFGMLLGAFQAAVHRSTGLHDFVIGCPASVRMGKGASDMVGYLVNSLALRARFTPDTTVGEAVSAAHEGLLRGLSHLRHPVPVPQFAMAVTLLAMDRLPVPGLIGDGNGTDGNGTEYAGLRLSLLDLPHMEGQFDFNVELRFGRAGLTVVLRYADDLFTEQTVRRFAEVFERMVRAAVEEPDTAVSRVPLVSTEDLADLLSLGAASDDW